MKVSASGHVDAISELLTGPLPSAILWDMDGTLVDTEPAWMAGEMSLAARHGVEWTEADAHHVIGMDLRDAANYMRQKFSVTLSDDAIISDIGAGVIEYLEAGIEWQPGVFELFTSCADLGIPQALVTMSYRDIAQPVIDALDFQAVITGDMVTSGKPHPEPYLRAMEMLRVEAPTSIAIEDSPTGIASATAAECLVVAVPHVLKVESAPSHFVYESLNDVDIHELIRLLP